MKYRPEIDGLRAIAVVSVLLYHAGASIAGTPLFPGGFIGVDIFFVISGYLISSLIFNELRDTGRFSFTNFYERRAKRILPALFVVMLASILVGWFVLLPSDFVAMGHSIGSSVLFVSNIYFYIVTTEYAAPDSNLLPLLHTWSLSVEEQFYLIFPVIVLICTRIPKTYWIAAASITFLASLAFAEAMTEKDPSFSFYLLPSRMWELLAGVAIALLERRTPSAFITKSASALSLIALLTIIASVLFGFDKESHHPGLLTLIPVGACALLILTASPQNITGKLLSLKPMIWIGLISYSLYLWHFPIFAFIRINVLDAQPMALALGTILSVALAYASYRWIETPFRKGTFTKPRAPLKIAMMATIGMAAISLLAVSTNGNTKRMEGLSGALTQFSFDNGALADERYFFIKKNGFGSAYKPYRTRVLIVGNSYGDDQFNMFAQRPDLFPDLSVLRHDVDMSCFETETEKSREFFEHARYQNADVILISSQFAELRRCDLNKSEVSNDFAGLPNLIQRAKDDGKQVVLTTNPPEFKMFTKTTIADRMIYMRPPQTRAEARTMVADINSAYFQNQIGLVHPLNETNDRLAKIAEAFDILLLDKADYICEAGKEQCFGVTPSGHKVFWDYGHITNAGAAFFADRMAAVGWLDPLRLGSVSNLSQTN